LENAADIEDIVTWLETQKKYKSRKIILIGQSTGGLATMAYSSLTTHPVDAIINFHGGMRPSSPPSLWFYTANDHSSNPEYISRLYKSFADAGGTAKLIQLPAFKSDGHYLFGDPDGGSIWQPIVLDYLRERHLIPNN
jgi:dienelactone hydrolase